MKLKIKGLKKIAGETKSLRGYYSGFYLQLNYNIETSEVWTDFLYSLGHNSWMQYHDRNIITICNLTSPMTTNEIRKIIEEEVEFIKQLRTY